MTVIVTNRDKIAPYLTKDGSEIRELLHPDHHPVRHQSLAEALVLPGQKTQLHRHRASEELYFILQGTGGMTLGLENFQVQAQDTVLIPPDTPHCIENTGTEPLRILCCCAPAYSHQETEIIEAREG